MSRMGATTRCRGLHPSPRIILMRMLGNLLFIFQRDGEKRKHDTVASWLKALEREL